MLSKSLNRSGILLIIAGILTAGSMIFHPNIGRPGFAMQGAWVSVHVLLGIAALIAILGLAGLYAPLRTKMTFFGQAAFGLAVLGNILIAGLMFFVEATLVPVLSRDPFFQVLLTGTGPLMTGSFGLVITATIIIAAAGWIFLAGYLTGTKTISVTNGLLLFIGAPLTAFSPPLPFSIGLIGGVLFGAGVTWLGLSMLTGTAHEALREMIRLEDECLIQAGGHA